VRRDRARGHQLLYRKNDVPATLFMFIEFVFSYLFCFELLHERQQAAKLDSTNLSERSLLNGMMWSTVASVPTSFFWHL
jgi:hypothetical protein